MKDLLYLHKTYDVEDFSSENNLYKIKDLPENKTKIIKYQTEKIYLSVDMGQEQAVDLKNLLNDIEEYVIAEILKMSKGNKNKASKLLKINRTTLIEKMKKINMRKVLFSSVK